MLAHWLIDVDDFASPDSLTLFQKELPLEWINQALNETNKASMRRRKLPAELVVWLLVGIGLYRDRPITDVLEKLDLKLSNSLGESIAPSAIPQARKRLTAGPLKALFTMTAQHWTKSEDSEDKWQARLALYPEPEQPNHIKGVLTSLTDSQYDLQSLLDVYFERWEVENSYGEIKHDMLEDELLLRSQSVEGIEQEVWGILIAYNLVRVEISRIAKEAKVSPLRISFMMALRDIQDELMWCAIASPGSIPKKLRAMRERVKRYILPERKKRPKSRTVRMSKTRYPVRSKHVK